MKEYLKQLRKTIKWVKENPNYSKETLILLTGAEPVGIEFPKKGSEWIQYEKERQNLFYKNTELAGPCIFMGSFIGTFLCGYMNTSSLVPRIYERFYDKPFQFNLNEFIE